MFHPHCRVPTPDLVRKDLVAALGDESPPAKLLSTALGSPIFSGATTTSRAFSIPPCAGQVDRHVLRNDDRGDLKFARCTTTYAICNRSGADEMLTLVPVRPYSRSSGEWTVALEQYREADRGGAPPYVQLSDALPNFPPDLLPAPPTAWQRGDLSRIGGAAWTIGSVQFDENGGVSSGDGGGDGDRRASTSDSGGFASRPTSPGRPLSPTSDSGTRVTITTTQFCYRIK